MANTLFLLSRRFLRSFWGAATAAALLVLGVSSVLSALPASASAKSGVINAIGAENEYANVLTQIGGKYVKVSSILNNPNTDPHTFEASPRVAEEVSTAQLIVQNGVGYDGFMNDMESASPNSSRVVIVVQHVLDLPNSTPNPHLWYSPKTMPKVAAVMAKDLAKLDPSHAAYFEAHVSAFDASLQPWITAIAAYKSSHRGTPVAVTEPVADYLLQAMGMNISTPFVFQSDIMNGVDPSPEDITLEDNLFTDHQVKVFCYNQQVVDALTGSFKNAAKKADVPVVGVYETMPTPGYDYQTWMMAELTAIEKAVEHHTSTEKL
jgi:zinc/manganese transport system substrate-binding protein